MQCVILAAGEGTRLRPLTDERPKPLVEVAGKPLLSHILERLPGAVTEIIIAVGYLGEQVVDAVGEKNAGRNVRYIWQESPEGTAHALGLCRKHIQGAFLLLNADDIYDAGSLERLIQNDLALLAKEHEHPEFFGVISTNADGTLAEIVEKPEKPPTRLVSTGAMVLDERIFNYEPARDKNGEYFIPTQLTQLAKDHPVKIIPAKTWLTVGKPEDIPIAERYLQP